jgi:trehalose 6-phosphate phosphatase
VFSDFDGTLAPIVDDPTTSRPLDGVTDALRALTRVAARVGVISGRPAAFLAQHLDGLGLSMWGLYGLETVETDAQGRSKVVATPEAEAWRERIEEVAARADEELDDAIAVERKGLTITFHFRTARQLEDAAREWTEAAAESTGLVMHPGRMSFELRPDVDSDKGSVLEAAAEGVASACFFGDDRGDLDAFDALDRLRERGVTTVKVAVESQEAPPELMERADVVVDGPEGVLEALRILAGETSD